MDYNTGILLCCLVISLPQTIEIHTIFSDVCFIFIFDVLITYYVYST